MKNTTNISELIKELKEFNEMKKQLEKELDELKNQAIAYLEEHGIDEMVTSEGKITYREVISNRFDSTSFKKDFGDVYEEYLRKTSSMRFTVN